MGLWVVARKQYRLFAHQATKTMGDEDDRTLGRIVFAGSLPRQIVQQVGGVINQSIRRSDRLADQLRILAERQHPGAVELRTKQGPGPRLGLSLSRPSAFPISGQAMDKADIDYRVGAVV